ncbi:hypothetical protein [Dongshaea marina]|uniref:hypothetical protein n=1 Tax=Dongshaea marina TaxID=2047966 RepID=UPI003898DF43
MANRINAQYANTDEQNLKKLIRGRVDVFPLETVVGYTLINKKLSPIQGQLLTNHPKALHESPYYLIVSRNIPGERAQKILDDFDKGLKKLKSSGEYAAIEELSFRGYYE